MNCSHSLSMPGFTTHVLHTNFSPRHRSNPSRPPGMKTQRL
uniref:Uncharacterized protein n=1 Tax=Anguilla anguilla TaxID=7936 RepID=A0A0E9QA61_ANGAN